MHTPDFDFDQWSQSLDDAEQQGYEDGYAAADLTRPSRQLICFIVGLVVGLLLSHFIH